MPKKKKEDEAKEPEYRFIITSYVDERTQEERLLFTIETTRVFRSFTYNVLVREKSGENNYQFNIEGLSMSSLTIPETGPARYQKDYPIPDGDCTFTVLNLNKEKAVFIIKFSKKGMKVLQQSSLPFIELIVQ